MAMVDIADRQRCKKLALFDVRRAHFYAPATRSVYVKLPGGDAEEVACGKLIKSTYGTRGAA